MRYVNSTTHFRQIGYVGDVLKDVDVCLHADADFAGDRKWSPIGTKSESKKTTMRSTSGVHISLNGPRTCFPIIGASKKQEATSYSTPEAEMVAGAFCLRTKGLPFLDITDRVLQRSTIIKFLEDNTAMMRVCQTGKNPTMRHLQRTHGSCVSWLHENVTGPNCKMHHCDTTKQCADVYIYIYIYTYIYIYIYTHTQRGT